MSLGFRVWAWRLGLLSTEASCRIRKDSKCPCLTRVPCGLWFSYWPAYDDNTENTDDGIMSPVEMEGGWMVDEGGCQMARARGLMAGFPNRTDPQRKLH